MNLSHQLHRTPTPPDTNSTGHQLHRTPTPPDTNSTGHDERWCWLSTVGRLVTLVVWVALGTRVQADLVEKFVSPSGGGDGTEGNPATFSSSLVNGWLTDANLTDLTVHFLPGDYTVTSTLWITEGTGVNTRAVRLKGQLDEAGVRPRLILGSLQDNSSYWAGFGFSTSHHWLIRSAVDTAPETSGRKQYLARFELEDLVLDGNFDEQGAFTGPASTGGYKSFAVEVNSRTGVIRNVLVRRFGSVGFIPWTAPVNGGAGTETFPVSIWTEADDKSHPTDWDPYPWLIENVELTEFRSLHGGYATLIMPHVRRSSAQNNPTDLNAPPIFAVRRCQVRGGLGTIAFGTGAPLEWTGSGIYRQSYQFKSQQILYEDNVVLNSEVSLNTDTGEIGWLTLRRNAFLDIVYGAFVGRAFESITGNPAAHHNYRLENNLIRLRGRSNVRDYRDHEEPTVGLPATNPNLALGRLYPSPPGILVVQGRATQITFANNWLTTRSSADFFYPSPGTMPSPSEYRIVWAFQPLYRFDSRIGNRVRYPAGAVTLQGCRLSGEPFDFALNSPPLSNELLNVAKLAATSGAAAPYDGSYSAGYQNVKTPYSSAASFQPRGKVERVHPLHEVTVTGEPPHLKTVREVVLGDCSVTATATSYQVTVKARLLDHNVPGNPDVTPGTTPVGGETLHFYVEVLVDGQIRSLTTPGPSGDTATTASSGAEVGVATKTLTVDPDGDLPPHAVLRVRAWWPNPDDTTFSTVMDPDGDAWSSWELNYGQVVFVDALPDVGDDKNTTSSKWAKFQLTRKGTPAQIAAPLTVNLRLRDHKRDDLSNDPRFIRPGSNPVAPLIASYGNSGSADYYVGGPGWPTTPQTLPFEPTYQFPGGQSSLTINVIPRPDNLTEQNVIVLQVRPGANYSAATPDRAEAVLYDGPEWTLLELAAPSGQYTYASTATGLNEGVKNADGSWSVLPQVTGTATWHDGSGVNTHGVLWANNSPNPAVDFGAGFTANGVTFKSTPVGPNTVVGSTSTEARKAGYNGSIWQWTTLPHLGGAPSGAWGASPDTYGQYIAGFSTLNGSQKPVTWIGGVVRNLVGELPNSGSLVGEARAVNAGGYVVGASQFDQNGVSRPFRTKAAAAFLATDSDELPVPAGAFDDSGLANGISAEGVTVGRFTMPNGKLKVSAYWNARNLATANAQGLSLGTWTSPQGQEDLLSEILGAARIANQDWVVGWSGNSETQPSGNPDIRAVLIQVQGNQYSWRVLPDPYNTQGASGWTLKKASAVNSSGWIIGNGYLNGVPRGFVLIRRHQAL